MEPNKKPQPSSLDGIRRQSLGPPQDLRPDHDLPAPKPTPMLENSEHVLLEEHEPSEGPSKKKSRRKMILFVALIILLSAAVVTAISAYSWYQGELAPASSDTAKRIRIKIPIGSSPVAIADQLGSAGVIKNKLAFTIYTRLSGTESKLKAGTYSLQPSLSTPKIVEHLVAGKEETFSVTFLPGATLANNRQILLNLGYSQAEVDAALSKNYTRPLFAGRPVGSDLEGYIYGETILFSSSVSVETILSRFFDEYETVIRENDLINGFKKQGLDLYQGIILASIVQRETSNPDSQRQAARVFLNRMKIGMNLGSDVTYQYAAKKMGVAPNPRLESPYNTRIYTGLPPGPIANPGKTALISVANPANSDYLFFLAGDDNQMHYAKTDAEHQRNIKLYCQKKCLIP